MTNDELVAAIMLMNAAELLDHIMDHPTNLTDPYYSVFGSAIRKRYEQLKTPTKGTPA